MKELLAQESIVLGGAARTRDDAITEAGQLLVSSGAVDPSYLDAMHERERSVSTLMGNGLAIPHGTNEAKASSAVPPSRSCAMPSPSTGTASPPSSSWESPAPATTT